MVNPTTCIAESVAICASTPLTVSGEFVMSADTMKGIYLFCDTGDIVGRTLESCVEDPAGGAFYEVRLIQRGLTAEDDLARAERLAPGISDEPPIKQHNVRQNAADSVFNFEKELVELENNGCNSDFAEHARTYVGTLRTRLINLYPEYAPANRASGLFVEPFVGSLPPIDSSRSVRVAFIADQGSGEDARRVLALIKAEGADVVVHSGDLGGKNNPENWNAQINEVFGPTFPYLVSMGNHDLKGLSEYQALLSERYARIPELACSGGVEDIGLKQTCNFRGIDFILSGVGLFGSGHVEYLEESLAASESPWQFCSWHKPQHLMQAGEETDGTGWQAYEVCRSYGAPVITGHWHGYARSHLMSNFETQAIASNAQTLQLSDGNSFAAVVGTGGDGGEPLDEALSHNPWWSTTAEQTSGALFCDLEVGTQNPIGQCLYKGIHGKVLDSFLLLSH